MDFSLLQPMRQRAIYCHSQGAKNYVRESHLARFLDLVIWGHEHECLADPWVRCATRTGEGVMCAMQGVTPVETHGTRLCL